ncbi:rhamnogalacturonidase [Sphingopyxis sp. NJF-3]
MTGVSDHMLARADVSRRAALLGVATAAAMSPSIVRATGALSGFHDVRDYGAKGDGRAVDSDAINKAIMAASRAGGGTVIIPPGRYLSFSIRLQSHITLLLAQGAVLEAADPTKHPGQYDLPEGVYEEQYVDYGLAHYHNSLIYGDGVSDVAVLGPGMIHGLGLRREGPGPKWHGVKGWVSPKARGMDPHEARLSDPAERAEEGKGNKALAFKNCRNILLRDITILQGGHFCLYALGCSGMTIDNLRVDTDRDGIDIDCCRDVKISNCTVNAHKDDAIVLKSSYALERKVMCEDVTIIGCKTSGYALGTMLDGSYRLSDYRAPDDVGVLGRIKLGTDSVGGFRNILVTGCTCENSRGLQMGAIDGGTLEDVTFSDITMRNIVNHPIFVRLSVRNRAPAGAGVATVQRVRFDDINVSGANGRYACGVVGIEDGIIRDVTFSGVHVSSEGGGTAADAALEPPERRNSSLEPSFMKTFPAHGLYVRHAQRIAAVDCSFVTEKPDARPAILFDNQSSGFVSGLRSQHAPDEAVVARNGGRVKAVDTVQLG